MRRPIKQALARRALDCAGRPFRIIDTERHAVVIAEIEFV
jgi:hypothetical protein